MPSPTITVSAGAPAIDLQPGTYEVVLTALDGPRTILPQTGPNAGKEVDVYDWTFALTDDSDTTIQGTTSTASGPKSKLFSWLTALLGGRPPAVGQTFDAGSLVGRMALATISINDGGWPRIENLSALPTRRQAATQAAAQSEIAQPAQRRGQPVAAEDLPF